MDTRHKVNFVLFVFAQIITVTFITLLQVTELRYFIVFLLLMHSGIVLFIISKKRFLKTDMDVVKFYKFSYLLLALYLPILMYKLPSSFLPYNVHYELVRYVTYTVTTIVVIASLFNTRHLYQLLKSE